ncbi:CsbD family protein [Pseudacidovorax sp. RU35E]|jgi:uncharacterized protein YjbJ (UPF0337 family)|uniref:CsbD family protein n=2 Tax=Pseudacidovorax TaxID=433923 RepID=UPI000955FBC8|nr:CsbD family protein [Pseudacidovorax sp. RU35E]SIQ02222.1 Uncharacterized conserved protein YjbJ, UPF0337 family [Pseudacidovorax sp. RU35E]
MFEQAQGAFQRVAGKAQDALGDVTGDKSMQAEGKAREAQGTLQQSYGQALDEIRETALRHPLGLVGGVAAVSFLLGMICARR